MTWYYKEQAWIWLHTFIRNSFITESGVLIYRLCLQVCSEQQCHGAVSLCPRGGSNFVDPDLVRQCSTFWSITLPWRRSSSDHSTSILFLTMLPCFDSCSKPFSSTSVLFKEDRGSAFWRFSLYKSFCFCFLECEFMKFTFQCSLLLLHTV